MRDVSFILVVPDVGLRSLRSVNVHRGKTFTEGIYYFIQRFYVINITLFNLKNTL